MDTEKRDDAGKRENSRELGLDFSSARCRKVGITRSNRKLAAAAGISERHLYRLKKSGTATSPGAQRLYEQMVGDMLTAEVLSRLGHAELIGTEAHSFLDRFMKTLTCQLAELQADEPRALDIGYADRAATQSVDRLRGWYLRENDVEFRFRR